MNPWNTYQSRMEVHGSTQRAAAYNREVHFIETKLPNNLSYQAVNIYPNEYECNINSEESAQHMLSQEVAIDNTDNLNEKTIYSMPNEDLQLGSLVYWMNSYWLITERDANTTLYTKAKLIQCNHLLKWISPDKDHKIMEQWCIVEDGTKYLTGEMEDRQFANTRGDSRTAMQIAKNKYTSQFTRESRFLIDDDDTPHKMAFLLTKPFRRGAIYNGEGIFKFVLQEVTATDYDNHELGIADYYKYFQRNSIEDIDTDKDISEYKKRKVWL